MFDINSYLNNLPHQPGVYRMLSGTGEILYVGKAGDLKKRVSSYFQRAALAPRIRMMVSQVRNIEITVTRSESEALLLENNLIKTWVPRYNILFRDDKSYPYITLTGHPFPRLAFHRGPQQSKHQYFGPYPDAGAVRESIQLLQKVFRVRTCEDNVFRNRTRPCLLHQIQRCSAPCVGRISQTHYAEDVGHAALFLMGKDQQVANRLREKMTTASQAQYYEEAAIYRDQISALSKVQEKQFVSSVHEVDMEVVACVQYGGLSCVNVVTIRGGRHIGDKSHFPANAEGLGPLAILEAFLGQHYLSSSAVPMLIVNLNHGWSKLEQILSQHARRKVEIRTRVTGERRIWLLMAEQNAVLAIKSRLNQRSTAESRLVILRESLQLSQDLQRIECFDVSHTMGEATVAACVVFDANGLQKSDYRRYNIVNSKPGDDVAALREALIKRYYKLGSGEGKIPDLILIDGGKGQVNSTYSTLNELGLTDIEIIGVAKGVGRKAGQERLVRPGREKSRQLAPDNEGLHLIQMIRDEAHRFAITGHRSKRSKKRNRSALEDIVGVGAKRRQKLLTSLGGLRGVRAASIDQLAGIEGISRTLAEKIYQELH